MAAVLALCDVLPFVIPDRSSTGWGVPLSLLLLFTLQLFLLTRLGNFHLLLRFSLLTKLPCGYRTKMQRLDPVFLRIKIVMVAFCL